MEQPLFHTAKKFKVMPSVRDITGTVFWDYKGVFLMDFLGHGDTVSVQCFCGIHERLWQAICHKRPALLCQGTITLHSNARLHTANWT
jgi:hypothetical protein